MPENILSRQAAQLLHALTRILEVRRQNANRTILMIEFYQLVLSEVLDRFRRGDAEEEELRAKARDAQSYLWHSLARRVFETEVGNPAIVFEVLGGITVHLEILSPQDLEGHLLD
jgi:hypothetical protein